MIEHKCDKCGKKIEGKITSSAPFFMTIDKPTFKLNLSLTDVVLEGSREKYEHLCKYCIIDIINTLDDRPKVHNPSKEYDQLLTFLTNKVRECKTTLDLGIVIHDYVETRDDIFGGHKAPF